MNEDFLGQYVQFPEDQPLINGCGLPESEDLISPRKIMENLDTVFMGRNIFYTTSTISTNEDAKILAPGAQDGTLVIAETQTGGKGRLGRRWESPLGGIFMSLILKPQIDPAKTPSLTIPVGYSIAKTLEKDYSLLTQVKWPNDVLVNGRKVAGILCEMKVGVNRISYVIVGIGVNANIELASMPEDVRSKSASLCEEAGQVIVREHLIANILNTFEPVYFQFLDSGLEPLLSEIEQILAYKGHKVVVENTAHGTHQSESGILQGLDKDGRLILSTSEGIQKAFSAGDVSLRQVVEPNIGECL